LRTRSRSGPSSFPSEPMTSRRPPSGSAGTMPAASCRDISSGASFPTTPSKSLTKRGLDVLLSWRLAPVVACGRSSRSGFAGSTAVSPGAWKSVTQSGSITSHAPRIGFRSLVLPPPMPLFNPPSRSAAVKRRPALPNPPPLPLTRDERTLRIALVTEYYYPHLGGVCEHVHFFAREARRRGHHVDIITSNIPGAEQQSHVIRIGRSQTVYANGSQARITVGLGLRREMRRGLPQGRAQNLPPNSPPPTALTIPSLPGTRLPRVRTVLT